jgi:propanediol dehydratase small subunit
MMRDVIAEALSVARSIDRTISLSYDMGDKTLSGTESENLRGRLGQALSQIIRESLTDGRVGHIDINLAGEQLHILAGTTAVRVALAPKTAAETDTLPSEKRRITPETEQGLRAQLNALMDPISLHETAS